MNAIDYVGLVAALGIYGFVLVAICRFLGFASRDDDDPPDPY